MKILNFRPMVFIAIFLILGIICSTYYFACKISFEFFISILSITSAGLIACIVLLFIFKNKFLKFRLCKRIMICIIAFIVGIVSVSIKNTNIEKTYIVSETYRVTGRVCAVPKYYKDTDTQTILLDDVLIEIGNRDFYLSGKVRAYLSSDYIVDNTNLGEYLSFDARVKSYKITDESEINRDFYNIANDIYYSATVKTEVEVLDKIQISVFEKLKINAKKIMDDKFPSYISDIGYGMLFGDDEYIDEDIKLMYNDAGISHLLAVSGLHVGFVVLLLSFILKLFKLNNKISSIILISMLFLYVVICGFATSALRAFIMTTCMLLANMFRKPYDSLSALGLACNLILIFEPFDLFTVGFQLSFMAVLGIILLYPVLMNFFSRFLFEQFASSLCISLSASLGIMPIMMISFEKFSILSVFTNMIVVPVASIGFMLLFSGLILSMISSVFSILIIPFETIMSFVTIIAEVASNISINTVKINVSSGIIFFWLGLFVIISEYVRIKPWIKTVLVSILSITTILIMLF